MVFALGYFGPNLNFLRLVSDQNFTTCSLKIYDTVIDQQFKLLAIRPSIALMYLEITPILNPVVATESIPKLNLSGFVGILEFTILINATPMPAEQTDRPSEESVALLIEIHQVPSIWLVDSSCI